MGPLPRAARKTAAVAFLLLVFILFLARYPAFLSPGRGVSRPYSVNQDRRPPSPYNPHAHEAVVYLDNVKEWWKAWITAIKAAKPGLTEIKPKVPFGNHHPEDIDASRAPARKLVELSSEDLQKLRGPHQQYLKFVNEYKKYNVDSERLFHHRGIVLVGGGEFFGPAIVTIKMLRDTGSDLPVEVFVSNWSEYEPDVCEEYLPTLNARCMVIEDFLSDHISSPVRGIFHYQLKSAALLFCSFRNVLLLDSDSMPMVDPALLFDSEAYVATGLITWPDLWRSSETPEFWTHIAGLPSFPAGQPVSSPESGQMVVDKVRHFKTLMLALYYNIYGPNLYYTLFSQGALGEGDKTSFEAAAVVLNTTYYRVHHPLETVGRFTGLRENDKWSGTAMVQFMPEDNAKNLPLYGVTNVKKSDTVAFLHANTPKMNAGHLVDEGDLINEGGQHLRLLSDVDTQMKLFGEDVEKRIWGHLRDTGCLLEKVIREWRDRQDLCKRLEQHYNAVF